MDSRHKTRNTGRLAAAAIALALLSLTGCATVASMAIKHVASKAGMSVAKSAYHKLKGQDKEPAQAGPDKHRGRRSTPAEDTEQSTSDDAVGGTKP